MKIPITRPGLFLFHRIGLHIARPISSAVPFQRTSFAIRILRHALQGAQFHYSLDVLPGIPRVPHQVGQFRKGFFPFGRIDRSIYRKQARKHSEDIPVHDWIRLGLYKGNDGRRSIFSYPFQRDHILIAFLKYPTETFHNIFCRGMQVTGATIITKPLPLFLHLVFLRRSQRSHIRDPVGITEKLGHPLRHPCLLKDYLGYPDDIRVSRFPPRKLSFIGFIPLNQYPADF